MFAQKISFDRKNFWTKKIWPKKSLDKKNLDQKSLAQKAWKKIEKIQKLFEKSLFN